MTKTHPPTTQVYPKECEVLYPPLTYLMSNGDPEMEGDVTVYSVEPSIS